MKKDVVSTVEALAKPIAEEFGTELYDVEFVKEGGGYYLRVYIDKEGGVDINDCENVSRALDPVLDEADPISEAYYLEVSSVGLDRPLKKEKDFLHFMGQLIEVRTYKAVDGQKEFSGILQSYENGAFTLLETSGNIRTFECKETALVRPGVEFE